MQSSRVASKENLSKILISFVLITVFLVTASCTAQDRNSDSTPTPEPTPTPAPIGDSANPVVWGLVNPSATQSAYAATLAGQLSARTGYAIVSQAYPTYNALLGAMNMGRVNLAFLPPLTLLYADEMGIAQPTLLTNHFGVYMYGTQFLANVDSGFLPYFDANTNRSTADVATAIAQFDDMRPCLVREDSLTSGILARGYFFDAVITTRDPVITQTTTGLIRALYIKGVCDFGATFASSGDPRTASAVQSDLPDVTQRVVVIWRSEPIIPSTTLAYQASLPAQIQDAINTAWMESIHTPEGKELLTQALDYSVQDLKLIDPSILEPLRLLVESSGTNLMDQIGY